LSAPEWFRGAIDLHVHSRPSIFPRLLSDREVVEQAVIAGMRAVVLKAHEGSTVERAAIAEEAAVDAAGAAAEATLLAPALAPASAPASAQVSAQASANRIGAPAESSGPPVAVRGGIVLNHFVGGLNPVAVEFALALGGAIVWLPTIHADNHVSFYGDVAFREQRAGYQPRPVRPISVLDDSGKLTKEAFEVLEVVASRPSTVLNNGHLSARDTAVLFREATRLGVVKLMVAHPELPLSGYSLDFQLEMAELGALIERCYLPHTERWGAFPLERTAREIGRIGAERCVLSTDLGQADGPAPVEGLVRFGSALIENGVRRAEIELMVKHNPAELLGL